MTGQSRRLLGLLQILAAVAASCFIISLRLSHEAKLAMAASDSAFDTGELKQSQLEAQIALTMSVSDLLQFRHTVDRLNAIALGSEATGRLKTALLAWSSLSATNYSVKSALASNPTPGQQPEQHMAYLLDRVAGVAQTGGVRDEMAAGSPVRLATHSTGGAAILIVAGLLAMMISAMLRPKGYEANLQLAIMYGSYFVAVSCWSIGWITA